MNPLGLYHAICRRLLVQEAEVATLGLEILREEIQLVRMGLYAETGLFLRAQAQTVMAGYHLPENALLIDTEDDIYQHYQHYQLLNNRRFLMIWVTGHDLNACCTTNFKGSTAWVIQMTTARTTLTSKGTLVESSGSS